MDFFQAQANAQRRTKWLVVLFVLAVAATIAAVYLVAVFALGGWDRYAEQSARSRYSAYDEPSATANSLWNPGLLAQVAGGVILLVGGAALFKSAQLRGGGPAVAEMVGGRRVEPQTTDLLEKRLHNVVEEMAIASGIPVPAIYVLDDEAGLNAFAAGLTPSDAVVAVTRGTLEKLNRDELQGVVAHEFSHILNGDMRLNVRLIAVLFGILFLTVIGRILLRSLRGGSRKRDGRAAAAVFAIGLALVLIGYIGYFFGRLIQAAVSRQREFLADASAVQFTRNPGGILGALKKIGAHALGSRIGSEKAAAIGHFFFAQGFAPGFIGLLATHPPLDVRIRAIDPQFDGTYPALPQVVDVARESFVSAGLVPPPPARTPSPRPSRPAPTAAGIMATLGTLTPEHVASAKTILHDIPAPLRQAAHSPDLAPALVYGLLLDADPAARDRQTKLLPSPAAAALLDLAPALTQLDPTHKLPLCQLALPALQKLSPETLGDFFATLKTLVEADGHVSTFEFALQKLLHRHVILGRKPTLRAGHQLHSFHAVRDEIAALLSAVAHASADDPADAARAFAEGVTLLKILEPAPTLLTPEACGPVRLDPALDRLALAAYPIKHRVLEACAKAAGTDGELRVEEAELIRAMAATLDCPMPPLPVASGSD